MTRKPFSYPIFSPSSSPLLLLQPPISSPTSSQPPLTPLPFSPNSAYGYSCSVIATNNAALQSLASGAVAAIKAVYGTVFRSGPICSTIYQATGSSVDYVNDVSKAQYTFTTELRDTGTYGFVLPADQILPSAVEAFAGVRYLLANMQ